VREKCDSEDITQIEDQFGQSQGTKASPKHRIFRRQGLLELRKMANPKVFTQPVEVEDVPLETLFDSNLSRRL
jgi:hypothetical protein